MNLTEIAVQFVRSRSDAWSDKALITSAVAVVLEVGEGWIDSHRLGDAVFSLHYDQTGSIGDPMQKRQYVQHLLREAKHVCRYADGGAYRVHQAEVCSPSCAEHAAHRKPVANPLCPTCFIRTNAAGECGYCG